MKRFLLPKLIGKNVMVFCLASGVEKITQFYQLGYSGEGGVVKVLGVFQGNSDSQGKKTGVV